MKSEYNEMRWVQQAKERRLEGCPPPSLYDRGLSTTSKKPRHSTKAPPNDDELDGKGRLMDGAFRRKQTALHRKNESREQAV